MSTEKRYLENLCFRLKMQGLSEKEIEKETGLTHKQVVNYISSHIKRLKSKKTEKEYEPNFRFEDINAHNEDIELKLQNLDDTLKEDDDFFKLPDGRDNDLYLYKNADRQRDKTQEYIENKYRGKKIKVLYMADLHIPFTVYDLVKHIIREHKDADILVLNGDILDLFNISTFSKDKTIALKRELEEGRAFLELVSNIFEDVILIEGNHERRLRNYIRHIIPVDLHFLFPQDALEVIQQGTVFKKSPLSNVHVVGSWWIQLWDTIFAHPDNYSSVPMRTVIQTSEHFKMVKNRPHKACIIGHTHQAGKLIDRDTLVMETGCLQYDVDYKHGSKFIKTTWTRAHAIIYFDEDGNIQFNESNVITYPI